MVSFSSRFGGIETRCRYAAAVGRPRTRWEEDNVAPLNVGAFVAVAGIVLAIVGLAVLLALT
jgi:hypothetical protein